MNVNFIISCHNTEHFLPLLQQLLSSFKDIKPNITVAYAGNQDIPCHVRINPDAVDPKFLELALTVEGFRAARKMYPNVKRFIKLKANVWPTNEAALMDLFSKLDENKTPYAGNNWHHNLSGSLSTDFFAMDITYGDFLGNINQAINDTEVTIFQYLVARMKKKPYLIPEREPVHYRNLYECKPLGLVMYDTVEKNLHIMRDWKIE